LVKSFSPLSSFDTISSTMSAPLPLSKIPVIEPSWVTLPEVGMDRWTVKVWSFRADRDRSPTSKELAAELIRRYAQPWRVEIRRRILDHQPGVPS
jgi:hypothetical protein